MTSQNTCYPFGMAIKPLDYEPTGSHRWKYNRKEHEETTGLIEFEAKNHDPMIGRFHGIDPKAETYHTWSPYVYAGNNPSTFFEVLGENAQNGKENNGHQHNRVLILL